MAGFEASQILDYVDRALSDDYLFDQLQSFFAGSRRARDRVRRRGAQDQKAQRNAFGALSALAAAVREARQPEPPPRRRWPRAVVLAGAGAGAVVLARRSRSTPAP